MKVYLCKKMNKKQLKELLAYCLKRCNNIYLTNYYTDYITLEEKEMADEELKNYIILEDIERRKKFFDNENYRNSMLKTFKTEEQVVKYFKTLRNQELGICEDGIISKEEIECIKVDQEDALKKRYASRDFIQSRLEIIKKDYALIERKVTNLAKMTTSFSTFVEYQFSIDERMKKVLYCMDNLYAIPQIDKLMLEDPVLCLGEKVILKVCTHEKDAILNLTDDNEYKEFLKLNILHNTKVFK